MPQDFGPGRDRELTRDMVFQAFEEADTPAMTIGDIAKSEAVDLSRQTVNRILREQEMADEWGLESGKVGNATAYWPKEGILTAMESTYYWPVKRVLEKLAGWVSSDR